MTVKKELWLGLDGLYQVFSENVVKVFYTFVSYSEGSTAGEDLTNK